MSLPSPQLDDLTWDDLRLLAQRRIPAASGGRWTLHAPVDPGVTLLELFAFLLEQQVFVLDQAPDSLLLALLALLGEAPHPPGVARTVVGVCPETPWQAGVEAVSLQEGAVIRPLAPELSALRFSVRQGLTPLRVDTAEDAIEVGVDGVPRAADLAHGRPVALTDGPGAPLLLDLALRLSEPLPPGPQDARVNLLLELAESEVPPEWSADAAPVEAPTSIEFAYVDGAGVEHPIAPDAASDGTGGLRRSGVLGLPWPRALESESAVRLRLRADETHFSAPPVLRGIRVNAAIAHHRAPVSISSAASGGPWERARADLARQIERWPIHSGLELALPAELGAPLVASVRLQLVGRSGTPRSFRAVDDLLFQDPDGTVFTLDRDTRRLRFGDGYAGAVPAPASAFELDLEVGGGPAGNLAAGLAFELEQPTGASLSIENVVPSRGGSDGEDVRSARDRVAASLDVRHRAVTRSDFETLVETTPGIRRHRAHVVAGHHPDLPCAYVPDAVTVFVVPRIDRSVVLADANAPIDVRAPLPDPGALRAVDTRLQSARLLTTQVFVRPPSYRGVALRVGVLGDPPEAASVGSAVRGALARYLDAVIGGTDASGWPFGHPLRPSELVRVAQASLDPAFVVRSVAVGLDGEPPGEDCADTPIGDDQLVFLESCRVELSREGASGGLL